MNYKKLFLLITLGISLINFSYAVTIAPAKVEFNVNPGEEIKFSIYTRNDGEAAGELYSIVKGFTEDEAGTKIWIEDAPEIEWVKIPEKVSAPPGEMIEVPVVINVPQDAPPGGHFLAIGFGTMPAKQKGSGISIGVNVLSLVYINVSGNRIDKISVSEFNAKKVYFGFPVKFAYKIKNEGNTYVRPTGDVEISNAFGRLVANLKVNERELQILPGKDKVLENEWKTNFAFGPYKAKFNINYGLNQSKNLFFNYWFFVFPIKAIIIALALIIFVFFILPRLVRKYNEYIIRNILLEKQCKINKHELQRMSNELQLIIRCYSLLYS
jgi:uncharacterized membrane protein